MATALAPRFPQDGVTERFDPIVGGIACAAILMAISTSAGWIAAFTRLGEVIRATPYMANGSLALNLAILVYAYHRYRRLVADLAGQRAAMRSASESALTDPLTRLANRRRFESDGAMRLQHWRDAGQRGAVLVIDIDAFKSVNDMHGHQAGDLLLAAVAARMEDVAPPQALCSRLGGDEFAMVMPLSASMAEVDQVGRELAMRLAEPVEVAGRSIATSASVGASGGEIDDPAATLARLLTEADAAMYWAKRSGAEHYARADRSIADDIARRDAIEAELRAAVGTDTLFPVYEPLIDLSTGMATGYEMLARWQSEQFGVLPPEEFIPIAESSGAIFPVADHLYRWAFADAAQWPAGLTLAINVSSVQLRDPWFAQKILQLTTEAGLPPSRLVVEITEAAMLGNIERVRATLTSLRNQGIGIALDDFGTGQASLATLKTLPFDSIKIDRSFVGGADGGTEVAEAVLHLGRTLGLPVVAEGIEDERTQAQYQSLDCRYAQGFLYGRELTGADVVALHRPGASPQRQAR